MFINMALKDHSLHKTSSLFLESIQIKRIPSMFFILMFSPKFSFFCLVGLLCLCCCAGYSNMSISCIETDKQALLKLKQGFIDDYDILSSWKTQVDCCRWTGVSCSNFTGHVINLDLTELGGNIDSSLCDLQHLTYLNLNYNNFEGTKIPECIGSLGQLRELRIAGYFESTSIGGTIPRGLQNLSNLQTLDLSYNDLIVNDLDWISHLPSLTSLNLSSVNLSQAVDWQSSLSKAPHLSEIHLAGCSLMSHANPASFVHTNSSTSLKVLSLSYNYLDSSILPWLSNISNVLTDLDLSGNAFEHIFPNALNINSLQVLDLSESHNPLQLSPKAFSNMNSLKSLNLFRDSLQHIPSDAFLNTTSLELLELADNELDNTVLNSIPNLCRLDTLWLPNNNLSGQLSDWIPQLRCAQNSMEDLDLSYNPFTSGPFPNFSTISKLVSLNLGNTSLHGSIPQSFGHLPYLSYLDLSDNNLTGPLPVFAGFKSLKFLYLSRNRLNGNIHPSAFRQVPNLVELYLSSNRFNSAINETHLSTLSNLRVLYVAHSSIFFNFSSNWVPPFQLQHFFASSCNFGPHFPRWLKYQRELEKLDISNASISDSIPQWLWATSLQYLNLSHNKLYGQLPKSVFIGDDYIMDLSFNNLSGYLPYFRLNASALLLSNNKFSGTISFICATFQPFFHYLDISSNFFSGRLPDCWGQLPYLEVLRLQNNHFSGPIPNSVGTLNNLQSIHLNNNNLSGNLPSLMNSSDLLFIDFGQNNLNGKLPSWIGKYLPNLIGLRLKANKLQGSIPTNLCNLPHLQILDLSRNNITGNVPHCFGNLSAMSNMTYVSQELSYGVNGAGNISVESSFMDSAMLSWKGVDAEYSKILGLMKTIDLSCNHLTGEIPSNITTLVALASLNLSRNNLRGSIPVNMGHMTMLESLDLSHNSLSGKIPKSFSSLSFLSVLNLSFNNLSGKIPTATQLQTFNAFSYMGNQGLCGPPLTETCPTVLNPNPSNNDDDGGDNLISFGFYVSMGLGFILGFWGVCGTLILKHSWRHSFFHFFKNMNDWIYVRVVILKTKIKRRFQK